MALLERYALGYSWHRAAQMAEIPARTYQDWLAGKHGAEMREWGDRMRGEIIAQAQPQYAAIIEKAQAILLRVGDGPGELSPGHELARWAERILTRTLWPAYLLRAIGAAGLAPTTGSAVLAVQKLLRAGSDDY